jgi:hypothetical protein
MKNLLLLASLLAPMAGASAGGDPDIRMFLPVPAEGALTESVILKSLVQITPVGFSYIDVARGLMARKLGHPSWNDPVNANPVRACAFTDHPIDCSFDGWEIYYSFDPSNTLTEVCVKARAGSGKPECSRA